MDEDKEHNIGNKNMQWRTRLFAVLSICETFLFAGIPFGWGTLLYVFKEEGIYSNLCTEFQNTSFDNTFDHQMLADMNESDTKAITSCLEQDQRFNLWFSIALSIGITTNAILGKTIQLVGATKARMIFIPIVIGGALCIAFTSKEVPWLILPGLAMFSVGGFGIVMANIRVSTFLTVGSSVYLGLLNGSFDASSFITKIIKVLFDNGISREYSFIGLGILHLIISGINTIIHSTYTLKKADSLTGNADITDPVNMFEDEITRSNDGTTTGEQKIGETTVATDQSVKHKSNEADGDKFRNEFSMDQKSNASLKDTSIKEHLTSSIFCVHAIFLSILVVNYVFFLGSINKQLELILNETHDVEYFTDVLSYTLIGGLLGSFIAGSVLEWQKHLFADSISEKYKNEMPQVFPLAICAILVIMLSAQTFISSTEVFYGLFVNVVLLRAFMYTVNMGFITSVFPVEFTSVLYGIVITVTGIISLLQYALFVWMNAYDGALSHVYGMLLGLSILTLFHPLNVYIQARKIV